MEILCGNILWLLTTFKYYAPPSSSGMLSLGKTINVMGYKVNSGFKVAYFKALVHLFEPHKILWQATFVSRSLSVIPVVYGLSW